ncbi:peptidoglycan-associated lipoprotein Pal [Rhodovibrio salinarum]|uniref:Peptidoglycan-associated lipoprotein n=1 Tax=Rhodovibrio salinarum TaxID=1087 RepID=A0A934QHZ0_9PROT|nr:peptidoglycan-associated lipoprotein Pal [Rhodovibrio salinarum]MBK1697326.1 peptidoglycan-associated lipoprotein [Rhodovibrio salinarum]
MRLKLLTLFAAALLLTACETGPQNQSDMDGTGSQTASQSTGSADDLASGGAGADTGSVSGGEMAGPEPGTQEHLVVNVGDRVFFGFDAYQLSSEAQATVEKLAAWLKQYPNKQVIVEGHADERGTREYNLALGARRANAVRDYLIVLGIDPNRVQTVSFGEERPAVQGSNEDAWAQNRRAVFVVEGTPSS